MKKIYTTIVAALVCIVPVKAQYTILQQHHEPSALTDNNKADLVRYDSINALQNQTGVGNTWDFSAMNISANITTSSYMVASSAPHASLFPNATLASVTNNNSYTYYKSDTVAKTFEILGSVSGADIDTYSDPKMILKFPITYGSTWNDAYMMTSGSTSVSGTYSATATGRGDLQLVGGPTKMFSNSMQITVWDNYTAMDATDTTAINHKMYLYFNGTNRYPLLIVSYMTMSTSDTTTNSANIYVNYLEAVGLTENNFDADYAIYPNPASAVFSVKLNNEGSEHCVITIQSIDGSVEKVVDLGNSADIDTTVDVAGLSKGVYIVTTKSGNRVGNRKLIIE